MCRIFGFRSVIKSQVHTSLVTAENALGLQSVKHPDGWGVCYYINGAPHLVKSDQSAINDNLFKKVSGVVTSETVLAHIRRATLGENNVLNTHPYQYGHWVFAHNGNIKNFEQHKEKLLALVQPHLRRFILGQTDSEVVFYILLSSLFKLCSENDPVELPVLERACKTAVEEIKAITGPFFRDDSGPSEENFLTFVLTDGRTMLAHQGGKHLYYSTYKNKCGDRDTCPSYSKVCENPTNTGYVNHLIFSSEPLQGENIWEPLGFEQMIGVGENMKLTVFD